MRDQVNYEIGKVIKKFKIVETGGGVGSSSVSF